MINKYGITRNPNTQTYEWIGWKIPYREQGATVVRLAVEAVVASRATDGGRAFPDALEQYGIVRVTAPTGVPMGIADRPAGLRPSPKALRVLRLLASKRTVGASARDLSGEVGHRFGARIAELRDHGIGIDTIRTGRDTYRYRLAVHRPEDPADAN